MICRQPYVKITRSIEVISQNIIENEFHIELYENRIITDTHHFSIMEVLDVSYKPFSGTDGIFYLHTNQGVFPFQVRTNPEFFIAEFKRIKALL